MDSTNANTFDPAAYKPQQAKGAEVFDLRSPKTERSQTSERGQGTHIEDLGFPEIKAVKSGQ